MATEVWRNGCVNKCDACACMCTVGYLSASLFFSEVLNSRLTARGVASHVELLSKG
jgi:hypothetical protein